MPTNAEDDLETLGSEDSSFTGPDGIVMKLSEIPEQERIIWEDPAMCASLERAREDTTASCHTT